VNTTERAKRPQNLVGAVLVGIVLLYGLVLVAAPFIAVLGGAFSRGGEALIRELTRPDVLIAFRLSLIAAFTAVIINTIAGIALAWVLVRHEFRGKHFFDALVDAPFIFSPVIFGYTMIVLFGRLGWFKTESVALVYSPLAVVIATVFVTLPFVVREVQPILASLRREQEDAAATMGASRWRTFRRVILPQISRALGFGIMLTFIRAIGDYGAVAVAGGQIERTTETATVYLQRALDDRNNVGGYGIALVLIVLSILSLVIMDVLRRGKTGVALRRGE